MRCISLHQPWASLIAIGAKPYETRSWMPWMQLIGVRIAIHAAKVSIKRATRDLPEHVLILIAQTLREAGAPMLELPLGAIVCTAVVESAERVDRAHPFARLPPDVFGDYSVGRCIWKFVDVRRLDKPVPCKGRQGFFEVAL